MWHLLLRMWHFVGKNMALQRAEQSFTAIPLILGMKIFRNADTQRDWRHEGDASNPPHDPNISPSFLGTIPLINLYVRVKAQKIFAKARTFSLKNLQTAKKFCIFAVA